jgi:hypothetical protein
LVRLLARYGFGDRAAARARPVLGRRTCSRGGGKGRGLPRPNPAGRPIEASTALREGFGEGGEPSAP